MFNVGYRTLIVESIIYEEDRYEEDNYSEPWEIQGLLYGSNKFKQEDEENNTTYNYVVQTMETNIKLKDMIEGKIVIGIDEKRDIFGNFRYNEIYLSNE